MTESLTEVFLALVRSGLFGQEVPEKVLHLTAGEWQAIHEESVRQTVTAIVYSAMEMLPDDASLPDDGLLLRWTAEVDKIERQGMVMDRAVAGLMGFFKGHGLHPVLMKGQAAALLYPVPHRRECGDIDLYFNVPGEWDRARTLLADREIRWNVKPDGSLCYQWDGVEVEHHRKLFDLCSPFTKRRMKEAEKEYGFRAVEICGASVTVSSPELDLLLMSSHIMKHAFGNGVGLRQICDIALLCRAGGMDAGRVRDLFASAGLLRWNGLLFSFLSAHLGLDRDSLPYLPDRMPDSSALLDLVLEGGNFGHYSSKGGNNGSFKFFCVLLKKLRTLGRHLKRMNFSFSLAPSEAFWTVISLSAGQFRIGRR